MGFNKTIILWVALFWCLCARAATPTFGDFDPTQFNINPNLPPGSVKISLAISPTNITFNIVSTTNFFTTNITSQTINAVSNFFQTVFETNVFVSYEVVSNAFFTNVTILNGNGPWILTQNGFGTNTWIDSLTVSSDLFVVGEGSPLLDLSNGDTGVGVAGFDGTEWYGNGVLLTNLAYVYNTNANNTGVFSFANDWATNISGNITLGNFTIPNTAGYESMVIWVTNTDTVQHSVTLPNGVQSPGFGRPPVYWVTNGANQQLRILVEHEGVKNTNSSPQWWW